MKIGILTYHHVINDGAVLQTLGHLYTLRDLFPQAQVEVIDYRYRTIETRERIEVLRHFVRFHRNAWSKLRKYRHLRAFMHTRLTRSAESLTTDDLNQAVAFINRQQYDVVIVGSDEVWKIQAKKYARAFPNVYWLPPGIQARRIGSAVSANGTDESLLSRPEVQSYVRDCLSGYSRIATRDTFTYDLVRRFLGDTPILQQVPDPTFGIEFQADVREKLERQGVDFRKKVFALSFSSGPVAFARIAARIRSYADAQGIQLVAIGQQNRYAHIDLTGVLNPEEWAVSYRHFDFCLTDRFHSTIFSMKNQTPFLVIEPPSKYKGSHKGKIVDLLQKAGLMDHHRFMQEGMDIVADVESAQRLFDREKVKDTVQAFRNTFREHLRSCINP